jgi:hypothetical protein
VEGRRIGRGDDCRAAVALVTPGIDFFSKRLRQKIGVSLARIKAEAQYVAKRKAPDKDTLRELFLKSGNLCAFPDCMNLLMNRAGEFIGQICHIEAAEDGGERFNSAMTDEGRAAFSNLMLMCYEHHVTTNNVEDYPVSRLQKMKADHEAGFSDPVRAIEAGYERQFAGTLVQIGSGHRAVTAPNTGTINMGDTHHHYLEPVEKDKTVFNPTASEIEILTRLAESQAGYLNAIPLDGGFDIAIDGKNLGGVDSSQHAVELHEALDRLLKYGLLSDVLKNGEIYHLSSSGREVARQLREQLDRGQRPNFAEIEALMPELLKEMKEDFARNAVIRELIILDSEGNRYNGSGVFGYYRSVHENLDSLFQVLENNRLVENITWNNVARYRVTERFARYLQGKG